MLILQVKSYYDFTLNKNEKNVQSKVLQENDVR